MKTYLFLIVAILINSVCWASEKTWNMDGDHSGWCKNCQQEERNFCNKAKIDVKDTITRSGNCRVARYDECICTVDSSGGEKSGDGYMTCTVTATAQCGN